MLVKLDYNNALDIFCKNQELQNRVYYDALENDSYYQADEILSYFRHYNEALQRRFETLKDYEIDAGRAWVKANDNYLKDFLDDCITVADTFGVFNDDLTAKIKRVYNKIDLFEDLTAGHGDISDTNYYRLEKWINETIEEACDGIARYAQDAYTQFDDPGILQDYFITIWLEYNDGLQVDEAGTVYETITTVKTYK